MITCTTTSTTATTPLPIKILNCDRKHEIRDTVQKTRNNKIKWGTSNNNRSKPK